MKKEKKLNKRDEHLQKRGELLGDADQFVIKIGSDHSFTLANWCWSCVDLRFESASKLSPTLKNEDEICVQCNGTYILLTENGEKVLKFIKMMSK